MIRKRTLRHLGAVLTCLAAFLGGWQMIERGSVRPGVLMIAAGLVAAIVVIWKEARSERREGG